MGNIYVKRRSGLLEPFEVPELAIDDAIERNWVRSEDGRLMEPRPPEYLYTSPLWSDAVANWFYGTQVRRFGGYWWGSLNG